MKTEEDGRVAPWSAVAERSADTALDSSGGAADRDNGFIQSGVALRFPPQSKGSADTALDSSGSSFRSSFLGRLDLRAEDAFKS